MADDKDWSDVLSPETIIRNQRKAESQLKQLSQEDISDLRRKCKTDLFFFTYAILGYTRLSPRLHGNIADWLWRTQNEQFRMALLPRAHFKTTVITIGDAIQTALPDEWDVCKWPNNIGPDVRILLGHEAHEGSSRFLFEITRHFCDNPLLMALYPELVPNPREQRMNKYELELPRNERWAEPTFDTIGVGGHSQGRHYNKIKLDDIFGDKARDSAAERERTIQWVDNIQAFLVRLGKDHIDFVGTRYSLDDVYGHIMGVYGPRLVRYIRRIREKNELTGETEFIFPEEFNEDAVAILKRNIKVWAAQYVNDPHEGLAEFQESWIKDNYFNFVGRNKIAIFTASGNTANTYDIHSDLDLLIFVDPATSGKTGIVITGTDNKNRVYVLEAIKKNFGAAGLVPEIFRLVQKYWPRAVIIEEVIFSAIYKPWLESEMRTRGIRFNVIPVKPKKAGAKDNSKMGRVRGLAQYFSAHQIYFHDGLTDLREEYNNFGTSDDIHLLDAMAYGPEFWRAGQMQQRMDRVHELEEELMEDRDSLTGY